MTIKNRNIFEYRLRLQYFKQNKCQKEDLLLLKEYPKTLKK